MLQSQLYGQSRLPNTSVSQHHQLVQHHLTRHYEGVARTYDPQAGLTAGVEIAETAERKSTVEVSTSTIGGVARSISDGRFRSISFYFVLGFLAVKLGLPRGEILARYRRWPPIAVFGA